MLVFGRQSQGECIYTTLLPILTVISSADGKHLRNGANGPNGAVCKMWNLNKDCCMFFLGQSSIESNKKSVGY